MPAPSKFDPRSHVRPVPPPIPSNKGLRIEARASNVYYTYTTNKKEVWETNYRRRQEQWQSKGFQSARHKPYKGIGDPVYLGQKPKKLVLHALGQMTDEEYAEDSDETHEDDEDKTEEKYERKKFNPFWMKKATKGLRNIPKELCHGQDRDIIRRVKLGQDFFKLLRQEMDDQEKAKRKALQEEKHRRQTEPQPPKRRTSSASSSSSSDEEAVGQVEFDPGLSKPDLSAQLSTMEDRPAQTIKTYEADSSDDERRFLTRTKNLGRAKSAQPRINMANVRPYTPLHSSINHRKRQVPNREALFHQLCVLHWLLEAMTLVGVEEGTRMNSITTCWRVKEMGGIHSRVEDKKGNEKVDSAWKTFAAKQDRLKVGSRRNRHRGVTTHGRRYTPHVPSQKSTARDTIATPLSQGSQAENVKGLAGNCDTPKVVPPDIRVQKPESLDSEEDEEDFTQYKSLFRFLDDYYDNLRKQEENQDGSDDHSNTDTSSARSMKDHSESEVGSARRSRSATVFDAADDSKLIPEYKDLTYEQRMDILQEIENSYSDSRNLKLEYILSEKKSSKHSQNEITKARNAPAVLDFKARSTSAKKQDLKQTLQQEFAESFHSKAILLHEQLEGLERDKFKKVESRFRSLPANDTSFFKAVGKMRKKTKLQEHRMREEQRQRASIYKKWYYQLERCVPEDLKEDFFIQEILSKIRKSFAAVDVITPNEYKFYRVLEGLRSWEICAPDVTAAIEFCREHIIEMSAPEYEEWFLSQFPKVVRRPQTAPAIRQDSTANHLKPVQRPSTAATSITVATVFRK